MPLNPAGRAMLAALAALATAGPAWAEGGAGAGPGFAPGHRLHRHAPARTMPPEVRYRDPRDLPPPRRALRFVPPTALIQAYLPRTTDTPMYNEPPSRFPQR